MRKVVDVLNCKCPKCEKCPIFRERGTIFLLKMPIMNDRCTVCDYKFEKEPGFFFGSMFISYALGAGQVIIGLILFWYLLELSLFEILFYIIILSISLMNFNFRLSRSIWIHMFYKE